MTIRVAVTGAAGNVGSDVCRVLADAGLDVWGVDRVYRRDLPVKIRVADLLDSTALYRALEGADAVVHLGNHPNAFSLPVPQRLYGENVAMNANTFHAAVDLGARTLIFASSVQVFSGDREGHDADRPSCLAYLPVDGRMPRCPRNAYALSKEAGELLLEYLATVNEGLSCVSVRFPFILAERHRRWARYYRRRSRRHAFWGNLDEAFAYLTGADAGRLVLAVLRNPQPGYDQLFPAAPGNFMDATPAELIERYYQGVPLKVPADQMESLVDISRITETYGWTPQDEDPFAGEDDEHDHDHDH